MTIRIEELEEIALPNFRGGEGTTYMKRFQDEAGNKIMLVRIQPGCSVGMHTHETDMEVCYVLSGHGKADYEGVVSELTPGVAHYCPKGHAHAIYNDGSEDLRLYSLVAAQ